MCLSNYLALASTINVHFLDIFVSGTFLLKVYMIVNEKAFCPATCYHDYDVMM